MKDRGPAWQYPRLGQIAEKIDYGLTASADLKEVGPKFLRITDIQEGKVDWETVPFCSCDKETKERWALSYGDVVFARTGATTGKSFLIRDHPKGSIFASFLIRVRPGPDIDPIFLSYFFQTPEYWRQIAKDSTGTAQPGVNSSKLGDLRIPLPPLGEQRRIAAILDKADAIRRKRREAIRLAEEFLQSVFLEMFGDPVTNPKGWLKSTFGEQLASMRYGPRFYNQAYSADGIRIVRITDLDEMGGLDFDAMPQLALPMDTVESFGLRTGDLIFARTGATVGKTALISKEAPACIAGAYFIVMRFKKDVHPLYARMVISCPSVRRIIARISRQSAQQNFSGPAIRRLPLPIPPSGMQTELRKLVDGIKKASLALKRHEAETSNLFCSLVQRAFQGDF